MEINNLEEKLKGNIPINRKELFELINSWGRKKNFTIFDENLDIQKCEPKECYDLSNLDVSKIDDLSQVFRESLYNGDLSKWDISKVYNISKMFSFSNFNNDSLKHWDTFNVKIANFVFFDSEFNGNISLWKTNKIFNIEKMFSKGKFDGDISKWDLSKVTNDYRVVSDNNNFLKKYNNGIEIPILEHKFLEWFKENKKNISNLNLTQEDNLEFDNYLNNFERKELTNGN